MGILGTIGSGLGGLYGGPAGSVAGGAAGNTISGGDSSTDSQAAAPAPDAVPVPGPPADPVSTASPITLSAGTKAAAIAPPASSVASPTTPSSGMAKLGTNLATSGANILSNSAKQEHDIFNTIFGDIKPIAMQPTATPQFNFATPPTVTPVMSDEREKHRIKPATSNLRNFLNEYHKRHNGR